MLRIQSKLLDHACSKIQLVRPAFEKSAALTSRRFSRQLTTCVGKISGYQCQLAAKESMGSFAKRNYAGKFNENYILEQNTLSETEKKAMQDKVKKDFEDWVPYGLCPTDKEEDIFRYKMMMVSVLTLGVVTFSYIYLHLPQMKKKDWAIREAYLELERRQKLGLPLVDKNLIPEEEVVLPALEELGDDYDIII